MTRIRCWYCLEFGHPAEACPEAAPFAYKRAETAEPPSTRDDAFDSLSDRCIRLTTYAGQLRREMREAGLVPTAATMALNPDPSED